MLKDLDEGIWGEKKGYIGSIDRTKQEQYTLLVNVESFHFNKPQYFDNKSESKRIVIIDIECKVLSITIRPTN